MNIPNTLLFAFLFLISNVIVINGAILPTVDIQGSVEKVTSTKSRQNKGIFVVSHFIKLRNYKLDEKNSYYMIILNLIFHRLEYNNNNLNIIYVNSLLRN